MLTLFAHQGLDVTDITIDNENATKERHTKHVHQTDTSVFAQISHRSCLVNVSTMCET